MTEADKSGDVKTLDRKLAENLYLAILDEDTSMWGFPTTDVVDDETLLEATTRIATETAGRRVECFSLSNSPMAVDLDVYGDEKRQQEGVYGSKTFFMKLIHDNGDIQKIKHAKDYAWLDREEMADKAREQEGVNAGKFYHYLLY